MYHLRQRTVAHCPGGGDDLIRIDIPERVLEIIGVKGEELPKGEVELILAERRKAWKPREAKYKKGVLKFIPSMPYHP